MKLSIKQNPRADSEDQQRECYEIPALVLLPKSCDPSPTAITNRSVFSVHNKRTSWENWAITILRSPVRQDADRVMIPTLA